MSKDFKKIKKYYDSGYWNEERVRKVVSIGAITEEEFEQIIDKKYEE